MNRAAKLLLPVGVVACCAQPPAQAPADVLRFYQSYSSGIILVDRQGATVHQWPNQLLWNDGIALQDDGTMLYSVGNGIRRIAFDGTVLWSYQSPPGVCTHHDIEALPNGNVLLMVGETKTRAEVIAHGRNPALVNQSVDFGVVVEVQPTGPTSGAVVWQWHVWDHLIQDFDPHLANYGHVADHPGLIDINYPAALHQGFEFDHLNGIDYDPRHDWIAISSPVHNEIWIVDHSTTTAAAASHAGGRWNRGGDLLYRWGNPEVYRAGPASARMLDFQHDPQFVPDGYPGAGNLTIFNNGRSTRQSSVLEIELPLLPGGGFSLPSGGAHGPAVPVWHYTSAQLYSPVMSSAQRLPNGNTLVCSSQQAWVFEVTPTGQRVWEHRPAVPIPMFHAHHTSRSLWADRQSLAAGSRGVIRFDLEAGSSRAGATYVVLGSTSGTSPGFELHGIHVPLNVDPYFSTLLAHVGRGHLASWVGTLDATGGASAAYALPRLPQLVGMQLDHAMLTIDPTSYRLRTASNPVPLRFRR